MKPIIFNTDGVRAILEGRKTVTRRVIKPQPEGKPVPMTKSGCWPGYFAIQGTDKVIRLPFLPGDILWVRETWTKVDGEVVYRADDECPEGWHLTAWKSPVQMPKEAARIFLRVTDVRVERLHDMNLSDMCAEGVELQDDAYTKLWPKKTWRDWVSTWESTIKPADLLAYGWDANPWVWVIKFERIRKEEAQKK